MHERENLQKPAGGAEIAGVVLKFVAHGLEGGVGFVVHQVKAGVAGVKAGLVGVELLDVVEPVLAGGQFAALAGLHGFIEEFASLGRVGGRGG